jgi:hypothetical protein
MTDAFPRRRTRALDAHLAEPAIGPRARGANVVIALLSLVVGAGPLGGQVQVAPSAQIAATGRCMDTVATATPARLDAKHLIYVEQQTVVSQRDGRVLVAGRPVFVWRDEGDRYEMLAVDSLFGMVVDSVSSSVRAIPSPFPGRQLDGMRAASLPDGWWLVTFGEVFPSKMPQHPIVKQMWAGETDGTRWRRVRKLPTLADSIDTMEMSSLVYLNGRARLAALAPRGGFKYAEIYSLDHDRWTVKSVNLRFTAYVNLSLSATHDLMAVVRPSEKVGIDINSLFLFAKRADDSVWAQKAWIVVGGERPVRDPQFSGSGPRVLSWRRTTDDGSNWDAWFATVDDRGDSIGQVTHVGPGAIELAVASQGAHHVWATFDRARLKRPTLRIAERGPSSDLGLLESVTDYAGLIGIAIARSRVVVLASFPSTHPRDPQVISVLRTHIWRCP